jgi:hypothetical protein
MDVIHSFHKVPIKELALEAAFTSSDPTPIP